MSEAAAISADEAARRFRKLDQVEEHLKLERVREQKKTLFQQFNNAATTTTQNGTATS